MMASSNRIKRVAASIIYFLALAAGVGLIYAMNEPGNHEKWLDTIQRFGVKPLAGMAYFAATLKYWWVYALAGIAIYAYFFLYRKKTFLPCLFIIGFALLWWGYYYIPVMQVGTII